MFKKFGLFSLLALMLSLFVACGGTKEQAKTEVKPQEIVVGVTSFADTLEPTEQYFSWVITRYGVGENLVRFDKDGQLQPLLAESWEVSDDHLTWTFKIRDGVKFSNGNALTAEAVKNSLERTFAKTKRAEGYFKYESIEADGQALKIKTTTPKAVLVQSLADPLFLIVDTSVNTDEFAAKGPICTGPYKFTEFKAGEYSVVEKNELYWGTSPKLDKVTFKDINDQNTRALSLKSGEIDIAYNLKVNNKADFEGQEDIVVQELKSLRTTYSFMNQNGALKDLALRQAIIRALDKQAYTQNLLGGAATPGKAPIPPTLDFGFDKLLDENTYNPESAKEILAKAGYKDIDGDGFVEKPDGTKLDLNFVIYTSRAELGIYAQAAQVNLKDIGVKVSLKPVSYETLLDMRDSGNFDLLIWNVLVANTGDPENYLYENWHSQSASNKAGYSNSKVDALLDELKGTFDRNRRKDIAIEVQQILMNDAATIFFGHETTYLFSNKRVTGLTMFPMDYYWITTEVGLAE
ncbi:MAG: ABC transporter substrate-binding protein [Fusobacterium sp.]|uniref:ABC transporter substrate-binding protein n=1 Tax=Fusobacterium sp. TaxID=68766 RepID=UPI0026DB09CF|nr:ABC transporter substrate-binding protein [Fusobacterium sp.]MDO4690540.1 ABC transporter substrate-binding protein [Fusobacterium sp.]